MRVVGITGGIGSGKTTVCRIFQELGVPVYFADDQAKRLMIESPELKEKITVAFGKDAYLDGVLNRTYLAEQIFGSKEKLAVLNGLVHPAVKEDFEAWLGRNKSQPYVLKEAAILFESGANKQADATILVIAPESLRLQRVMQRDGSTEEEIRGRMASQWSQEKKEKLADHIINNDGTHLLIPQVLELHRKFSAK